MTSPLPLIDIVMLVHDQAAWADLAIRAVEAHTRNPYRLIIVDSASVEPATQSMLAEAEKRGHTVVRLAENRSFSNGVNAGVMAGSSKFICVLNDDALVTEGWDGAMLQDALVKSNGLVGARSNFAAGMQGNPALSLTGEAPFLVFVCVMLRREVWNAIGPMDEITFDGFSSEDLDYSWRVLKSGLKLKISNAYVLHAGSRTLMAKVGVDADARRRNDEKYNVRLADKWGVEWIKEHTKLSQNGLVASFHAEEWTRVEFMGNLMGLRRSDNVGFSYYHHRRSPIHAARQLVADYATDQGFDWIVQLDDDATFPPDLLRRLLSHNKEVVCALAYTRVPPHTICAYDYVDQENPVGGKAHENIEHTGLRRVDVSGFHCSIMHTSVIKKMRAFRSEKYPDGIRAYYGGFEGMGEDFAFCRHLREVGIPIYCDTELISGHIGSAVIVDEEYKKKFMAGKTP